MTDGELHTMADVEEEAEAVKERVGCDFDIPSIAAAEGTIRDATLEDAIRVYPAESEVGYDLPNQINWDLKGTFKWRAVALHDPDGDAMEWYAYDGGVRHYWPDHYDEPVWARANVYEFIKSWDEDEKYTLALHHWPVDMDPDAEVVG